MTISTLKAEIPHLFQEDCVRDLLDKLNFHKSMGPHGIHPRVLREFVDVAKSLSITFEGSWRMGELPGN